MLDCTCAHCRTAGRIPQQNDCLHFTATPAHLLPDHCYVCGLDIESHGRDAQTTTGHDFWSNDDADTYFGDLARRGPAYDPAEKYVDEFIGR